MVTSHKRKVRVLLAKSTLDPHDRAIRYVAKLLSNAGIEVILINYEIIDSLLPTVVQEDVDVVGLSFYTTGYKHDIPKLIRLLKEEGVEGKIVIVGGIILPKSVPELLEMGVKKVFGPGSPSKQIIDCIFENVA